MKKKTIFFKGCIEVLPLLIPVFPFGLIIGVIGVELGFSPLLVYASSLIIFSGSAQIVFFQLLSGGASAIVTLTSVGVTNSRHFLYGAVLSEYLENLSTAWKAFLSYFLVDQSFALSHKFFKENKHLINKHYYLLGSGFTLWFVWQISTLFGIFLGSIVPDELGLAFAIPLTFLSLIIHEFRKWDHLIVIFVSGFLAILFYEIPFKAYIIAASIGALIVAWIITIIKLKKK
ncbi:AzlC family ABC transporter permease [Candidatus Pelagibacter sp.]|nr:AzlC family ABC transporter permease [Candidatus Pelagibacter sp.]|tara:strand:+ start:344 stop:1036 length:693 start_codon:yes stop_codon:yes gene_type:complete